MWIGCNGLSDVRVYFSWDFRVGVHRMVVNILNFHAAITNYARLPPPSVRLILWPQVNELYWTTSCCEVILVILWTQKFNDFSPAHLGK